MKGEDEKTFIDVEFLGKHCPLVDRQGTGKHQQLGHTFTSSSFSVCVCVCGSSELVLLSNYVYCTWFYMNKLMSSTETCLRGGQGKGGGGAANNSSSGIEMDVK